MIEHIFERTVNQNEDKNGRSFAGYSKSYQNSLDFRNAGKSKSKVDLQLSGDMLAALSLLKHSNGELVVGFKRGSEENAKADGNIRGTYGQASPIPGKKRDFLGISPEKLKELIDHVASDQTT